jgi:hypothetical protein
MHDIPRDIPIIFADADAGPMDDTPKIWHYTSYRENTGKYFYSN